MRTLAAALFALLVSSPALASHPGYHDHYEHRATVVVHVDPYAPNYRPAPRAGFVFVDGYYDCGTWIPGYWEPVSHRAGYTWVRGYWQGRTWMSGYWRPRSRANHSWVAGYWNGRTYVTGYWAPSSRRVVHTSTARRAHTHHNRTRVVTRTTAPPRASTRTTTSRPSARPDSRSRSNSRSSDRSRPRS